MEQYLRPLHLLLVLGPLLVAAQVRPGQPTAPGASEAGSKTWVGRYAEIEEYLRTAECLTIEIQKSDPQGAPTHVRCALRPGGPAGRLLWKSVPPGVHRGFRASYKSEIAAYEVDKLLKMDMVAPAVERDFKGTPGAAVLWVEKTAPYSGEPPNGQNREHWDRQLARMVMFDRLIGNGARNLNTMLVDGAANLILIDHTRAFDVGAELPTERGEVDREYWTRIAALTRAQLDAALRPWLDEEQIAAILARRDKMRAAIERRR